MKRFSYDGLRLITRSLLLSSVKMRDEAKYKDIITMSYLLYCHIKYVIILREEDNHNKASVDLGITYVFPKLLCFFDRVVIRDKNR